MNNYEKFKADFKAYMDALPFYERWWIDTRVFFYQLWYWRIGYLLWKWFKIDIYGGDDD